jgi:formyltetrahydrofolate hydrolase
MTTHLLLIDCPDAKGLVYTITGVLYRYGYNITTKLSTSIIRSCRRLWERVRIARRLSGA